jgi:uncharacterized membrane protein
MQALTTTVARILFALPFGIFGVLHLMGAQNMAGMVPSWIPGGVFWVYLTGLAHIAATISIISQKKAKLASLLLAAMLGVFIITIYLPGIIEATDDMGMMMNMSGLLKDSALAGAALTYAGLAKD